MNERITDRAATVINDYFDTLENQRLQNQMANTKAERDVADKTAARQVKRDGQALERDIMQATVDAITSLIDKAKTEASRKAAAPMSIPALHQLETLRLRSTLSEAEVEAVLDAYGDSYQFRAALKDIADSMGAEFTVNAPGLQEFHDALDKLQQSAAAVVWNASGTTEKDRANFEGSLFLWRALSESAWSKADVFEELFERYGG
jgi:ribosomal 50S subunit-associated protein YjgA (DUF615 family)